jgi:autotransporter passenger strand-loop-strand repeat protein
MTTTIENPGVISSGTTIVAGETLQIVQGDIFTSTMILSGGELNVNGAAVASHTVVSSGGVDFVNFGGTAYGNFILSGGYEDDDGSEYYAQVQNGGQQLVYDGIANDTDVEGGSLEIVEGEFLGSSGGVVSYHVGSASGSVVFAGGVQQVEDYGTATNTDVASGGEILLTGGVIQGGTVHSGGILFLQNGIASGTTLESGATLVAFGGISGAITSALSIDPGATVISTGVVQFHEITSQSGLTVTVEGFDVTALGSAASGLQLDFADPVFVLAGGTLVSGYERAGDTAVTVENGGTALATQVYYGTTLDVAMFGEADSTTLYQGGVETVAGYGDITEAGGGARDNYAALSGGTQVIEGRATSASVFGGVQSVTDFGVASATTALNSGVIEATDYGVVIGAVISSGGGLTVSGGASTQNDVISAHGFEDVYLNASDDGTTVSAGGSQVVDLGGATLDDDIAHGGIKVVNPGGFAQNDTIDSGGLLTVNSGGQVTGADVRNGGTLMVYGTATGINLELGGVEILGSGAQLVIQAGQTIESVVLNDAAITVSSGGTASAVSVGSGGQVNVSAGGFALFDLLSGTAANGGGATENISAKGTATGTDIKTYGVENIMSGGVASQSMVEDLGTEGVGSAGISVSATIMLGGEQLVQSGTAIGAMVENAGRQLIDAGGVASATTVSSGGTQEVGSAIIFEGLPGGVAVSARVLGGGTQQVDTGATTSFTMVSGSSATELVQGIAVSTTIGNGGTLSEGGLAALGASSGTRILSGGLEQVGEGSQASFSVVSNGGTQMVDYGTAISTTILGGGVQIVAGGTIGGGMIADGGRQEFDGGTVSGSESFSGTAILVDATGFVANGATIAVAGQFENNAYAELDPSSMSVGDLTGSGTVAIDSGSVFAVTGSASADQTIAFTGASGVFRISQPGSMHGLIGGFMAGDTIDFTTIGFVAGGSVDPIGPGDVLTFHQGGQAYQLDLSGNYAGAPFALYSDGATGTNLVESMPCFAAGTHIATPRGAVAVEGLAPGEQVQTHFSGIAIIKWVGFRRVDCRRHPNPRQVWPVRVAAGAFSPLLPHRDLFLSPDHAFFVDDVLIPVKHLINGTSVAQMEANEVEYWHVELDRHDVLLAEGLPCESYLDTGYRSNFMGGEGPIPLHPDFAMRVWEAEGCAPLVVTGPKLEALRGRINARAAEGHSLSDAASVIAL